MNLERLIERTKHNEGFKPRVYKDSLGIDTVGYGFTMKDLELHKGTASTMLRIILMERIIDVHNRFSWFASMPSLIQEVIVEMCYQLGISGFAKFQKTIEHFKKRDWLRASREMLDSRWAREQTQSRAKRLSTLVANVANLGEL